MANSQRSPLTGRFISPQNSPEAQWPAIAFCTDATVMGGDV